MRLLFKGVLAALTMTCGLAHAAEVTIRFPVEYSLEVAPGAAPVRKPRSAPPGQRPAQDDLFQ